MTTPGLVCVGRVLGVHGLRGLVKVQSFTDPPEALFGYVCHDEKEESSFQFETKSLSRRGTYQGYPFFLAKVCGCDDRDAAEALKGQKFYIKKETLSSLEPDAFYYHDLKGLKVKDSDGSVIGQILGVHNFGAGDVLEIVPPKGPSFFVRFHRDDVTEINTLDGQLTLSKEALSMRNPSKE